MARLLSFPDTSAATAITPISGPNARNSGTSTASDGSEQTFDHIGDVVAFRLDLRPQNNVGARRERGWMTGLLNGANATRLQFFDPDRMTIQQSGLESDAPAIWTNGETWSNGQDWAPSYPLVGVSAPTALNKGIVQLGSEFWGLRLDLGDYIGFGPLHFGIYTITETFGDGIYRIWPRLRKAIDTTDFATLTPTIVMSPLGEGAISMKRGLVVTENQSIDLREIPDYDVREYFGGGGASAGAGDVVLGPEAILLSNATVNDGFVLEDTLVGDLSTTGGTFPYTYTLLTDAGGRLKIVGTQLFVVAFANFTYIQGGYVISVRTVDIKDQSYSQDLTISVSIPSGPPTDITLISGEILPDAVDGDSISPIIATGGVPGYEFEINSISVTKSPDVQPTDIVFLLLEDIHPDSVEGDNIAILFPVDGVGPHEFTINSITIS